MSPSPRPESVPDPQEEASEEDAPPRKQIYLRTVYALNPGIPHYVDVPGGWQ